MKKETLLEKIKKFPHEYSLIIALISFMFSILGLTVAIIRLKLIR